MDPTSVDAALSAVRAHLAVLDAAVPQAGALAATTAFCSRFVESPLANAVAERLLSDAAASPHAHHFALQIIRHSVQSGLLCDGDAIMRLLGPVARLNSPTLLAGLGVIIAEVAKRLFPARWPGMVTTLMAAASTCGPAVAAAVLRALYTLVMDCSSIDFLSHVSAPRRSEILHSLAAADAGLVPSVIAIISDALPKWFVDSPGGRSEALRATAEGVGLLGALSFAPPALFRENDVHRVLSGVWDACARWAAAGGARGDADLLRVTDAVTSAAEAIAVRKFGEHGEDADLQTTSLGLLLYLLQCCESPAWHHPAAASRVHLPSPEFRTLACAVCAGGSSLLSAVAALAGRGRGAAEAAAATAGAGGATTTSGETAARDTLMSLMAACVDLLAYGQSASTVVAGSAAGVLCEALRCRALLATPGALDEVTRRAAPALISIIVKRRQFAWAELRARYFSRHVADAVLLFRVKDVGEEDGVAAAASAAAADTAREAAAALRDEFSLEEADDFMVTYVACKSRAALALKSLAALSPTPPLSSSSLLPAAQLSDRATSSATAAATAAAVVAARDALLAALAAVSLDNGGGQQQQPQQQQLSADPCAMPYGVFTAASRPIRALDAAIAASEMVLFNAASASSAVKRLAPAFQVNSSSAPSAADARPTLHDAASSLLDAAGGAVFSALISCRSEDPEVINRVVSALAISLAPTWYTAHPECLGDVLRVLFAFVTFTPSPRLLENARRFDAATEGAAPTTSAAAAGPPAAAGVAGAAVRHLLAESQYVRQRACHGLVSLARSVPALLLPALQPLSHEAIRLLSYPLLDPPDRVALFEMLALVSNAMSPADPPAHAAFLDQLVSQPLSAWADAGLVRALSSPQALLTHIGLLRMGGMEPHTTQQQSASAAASATIARCDELSHLLHLTWSLARRCTATESDRGATTPSAVTAASSFSAASPNAAAAAVHPFTRYWPALLPPVLALLRCIQALWSPECARALLVPPRGDYAASAPFSSLLQTAASPLSYPGFECLSGAAQAPSALVHVALCARFLLALSKEESASINVGAGTTIGAAAAAAAASSNDEEEEEDADEDPTRASASAAAAAGYAPLLPVLDATPTPASGSDRVVRVAYKRCPAGAGTASVLGELDRVFVSPSSAAPVSFPEFLAIWSTRIVWHCFAIVACAARSHMNGAAPSPPVSAGPASSVSGSSGGSGSSSHNAAAHSSRAAALTPSLHASNNNDGNSTAAAAAAAAVNAAVHSALQSTRAGLFSPAVFPAALPALADGLSPDLLVCIPLRRHRHLASQCLLSLVEGCPPTAEAMAALYPMVFAAVGAVLGKVLLAASAEAPIIPPTLQHAPSDVSASAAVGAGAGDPASTAPATTPASLYPVIGVLLPSASRSPSFLDRARDSTVAETGRAILDVVLAAMRGEAESGLILMQTPAQLQQAQQQQQQHILVPAPPRVMHCLDAVLFSSPQCSDVCARVLGSALLWRDAASAKRACAFWIRVLPKLKLHCSAAEPAPPSPYAPADAEPPPTLSAALRATWTDAAGCFFRSGVEALCTSAPFLQLVELDCVGALSDIYCTVALGMQLATILGVVGVVSVASAAARSSGVASGPSSADVDAAASAEAARLTLALSQQYNAEAAAGCTGPASYLLNTLHVSASDLAPVHAALARTRSEKERRYAVREMLQSLARYALPSAHAASLGVREGSAVRPVVPRVGGVARGPDRFKRRIAAASGAEGGGGGGEMDTVGSGSVATEPASSLGDGEALAGLFGGDD